MSDDRCPKYGVTMGEHDIDGLSCLQGQLAAVQSLVDAVGNADKARKVAWAELAEHAAVRPPIRARYPNVDVDMQAWSNQQHALKKRASKAEWDFATAVDATIGDLQ